jgi:hypothetical protein
MATFMGFDVPGQEYTVDLTKPFDIKTVINLGDRGAKFVKSGEGKARITVRGREYDTTWVTGWLYHEMIPAADSTLSRKTRCEFSGLGNLALALGEDFPYRDRSPRSPASAIRDDLHCDPFCW